MDESRKIVLILGNGFDLDLGLKTSYKDFWESKFCPKDYPAPLVRHLNNFWPDNRELVKWYDLENELLNYYLQLRAKKQSSDIISEDERKFIENVDLGSLVFGISRDYIQLAQALIEKGILKESYSPGIHYDIPYKDDLLQNSVWRDRRALQLIKEGLCKYLYSIRVCACKSESVAMNVLLAAEEARESGDTLNIYTFNYTQLPVDYGDGFRDIVHYVHGSCSDEKIIIGTRDDEIIDEHYDFLQKSFDPHFNPPALVADLLEADEVIIFGHSIGENDRQYFKAFFKQLTDYSNPKRREITIFTRDEVSEVQIKRSLQRMTDGNLSTLFGLNHIQILKTANLAEYSHKMMDFFVNHHIDYHHANVIVGRLLNQS